MIGISLAIVGVGVGLVQGVLVRAAIPRLGQARSVYVGLGMYAIGNLLYALADRTWMMFAFTAVYVLGGIAGPALQGIISNQVPPNEQGELQGALTSLASATTIVGPPLMTGVFAWFTRPGTPIYLPGSAMLLGSVLSLIAAVLARRSLKRRLAS